MEEEMKDITWSANFEICINGESANWSDLSETAQATILDCIKNDSYSGMFLD